MAPSTIQTALAFILFAFVCNVTIANPIPGTNSQETYNHYARLVCQAEALWGRAYSLFDNFQEDRFPNTNEVKIVDVPNLFLTNDMGIFERIQATDIELLKDHRKYLLHYKYIMNDVMADESNTTSSKTFTQAMNDVWRHISFTIAEVESVMIHLGHQLEDEATVTGPRPHFNPKWEQNVIERYERDLYVLEQIETHVIKVVEDFTKKRDDQIDDHTTPVACSQAD